MDNSVFAAIRRMLGIPSPTEHLGELSSRSTDCARELLDQFVQQNTGQVQINPDWAQTESGQRVNALTPPDQLTLLLSAVHRLIDNTSKGQISAGTTISDFARTRTLRSLVIALFRKPLPYADEDLCLLVQTAPSAGVIHAIATRQKKGIAISPALRQTLHDRRTHLRKRLGYFFRKESEDLAQRIDDLLGEGKPTSTSLDLTCGEAWSDAVIADLAAMSPQQRQKWMSLLLHCRSADGTKPSKRWLTAAAEQIAAVGPDDFSRHIARWFAVIEKPRTEEMPMLNAHAPNPNLMIADSNADILKGLAWSCSRLDDPQVARALGDAGCAAFKKVPNHGPRCVRLGNAVIIALSAMPGTEPAAQLGRLSSHVKHPSARRYVAKGIQNIATRTGQSPEDLAELAVPTFDLSIDGTSHRQLGDITAEIAIVSGDQAELRWFRADGKQIKSTPAEIKQNHSDDLKRLGKTVKDIQKLLPAQRIRVERLMMARRQWSYSDWRARYIDQPLISNLTKRLIWEFHAGAWAKSGMLLNGTIVDQNDTPFGTSPADCRVSLWHPIRSTPEDVLAWRQHLSRHQITQPFKQAHREIYLLTDAELATVNYSNRFAAHILRQHQLSALAQSRGWTYRLQGSFDGYNAPTLRLPQHDLRAEYIVESAEDAVTSDAGISVHVSTDQVIFYRLESTDPLPLSDVDSLFFSEIMRDVDLFVGVASVANDPTWHDRGLQFNGYWQNYSFGDLSQSAITRKAVLQDLIPRLKIAPLCRLEDKFLIVRGSIRTYKIHLGSGNILMEPNDQYLCIVRAPGSRAADSLFLPFEGDATLSIIISKALLLADDCKITDESIVRQIRPK